MRIATWNVNSVGARLPLALSNGELEPVAVVYVATAENWRSDPAHTNEPSVSS